MPPKPPSGKQSSGNPPPGKKKTPVLEIFVVVLGVLAIMGYNRMTIARLARTIPNVNSEVVGEWKSTRGPEHLVFREDKSVTLFVPVPGEVSGSTGAASEAASSPAVPGKYQIAQGGKIFVELMNGNKYSTTISPQARDRFDLIDARTDGVTTYERVKTAALPAPEKNQPPSEGQPQPRPEKQ